MSYFIGWKQTRFRDKLIFLKPKNLANKWRSEYIETSAETNFNCKEAFEILAKKILLVKKSQVNKKECCCSIY